MRRSETTRLDYSRWGCHLKWIMRGTHGTPERSGVLEETQWGLDAVRFECINGCGSMIKVQMPTCRFDTLAFMLATASAVGEGR